MYAKTKGNHNVRETDFLECNLKNNYYDVVCMWDTIEHLKSPNSYIAKVQKILNNKGIFVFTTGDINSFVAKFRKHKWRMIHPPTHIHYFSKKSVCHILKANNFKILSITYPGSHRTFDNILYNLFILRKNMPWIYNFSKKIGITKYKIKINLFDIMLVIAQKQ
jgi:2-polyprenyl-3-methyl-5-hydroxy-6-metoxy-1,4-benzoquinol methylase